LRETFRRDRDFWRRVQRRGIELYRKGQRKGIVADRFVADAFDE
jgi:hypothetical protein